MKRTKAFLFLLIFCLISSLITTISAQAHPGKTDSNGGHYDRSTEIYHYHHGYPEHDHPNGVCPYSYSTKSNQQDSNKSTAKSANNKTPGKNKTSSNGASNNKTYSNKISTSNTKTSNYKASNDNKTDTITKICLVFFILPFAKGLIDFLMEKIRKRK